MNGENSTGPFGKTIRDAGDYVSLSAERLKLWTIENLAVCFNTLFGILLMILLLGIAVLFFAVALTWILGILLGSYLVAVLLMGGAFAVCALIVYSLRRKLVVDPAVRMLCRMADDMNRKKMSNEKSAI